MATPPDQDSSGEEIVLDPERDRLYVAYYSYGGERPGLIAYQQSTGAQLWTRLDGNTAYSRAKVAVDLDTGNVGLGDASTAASVNGEPHLQLSTFTSTGQRRWHAQYDSPSGIRDFPVDLVAGGGSFYSLGNATDSASQSQDPSVVAYSGDGTRRWQDTLYGPAGKSGAGYGLALDSASGTLVVHSNQTYINAEGRSKGQPLTTAYAAADGQRRWQATGADGSAGPIALDPGRSVLYVADRVVVAPNGPT